jgi:hypothetical protein
MAVQAVTTAEMKIGSNDGRFAQEVIIPAETLQTLEHVIASARERQPGIPFGKYFDEAKRRLPGILESADLRFPVKRLAPIGEEIRVRHGEEARDHFARALVAHFALERCTVLCRSGLPASVLDLYPAAVKRMGAFLIAPQGAPYWIDNDAFLKDVRIAAAYSVPGGAQDVDLFGAITKAAGIKAIIKYHAVRAGWYVFLKGGPRWFTIHTDQRYLEEFNEAGWDRCYLRIAELLQQNVAVKGMVGTSWFYDPQLVSLSPRLAYLQQRPLERGALLVPHGPGAIHTERALQKSETRKKAYEEGRYRPFCYSVVWPRDALIAWARRATAPMTGRK